MGTKRLHYSENFSEEAADFTLLSLPEPLLATLVEQDGGCASILSLFDLKCRPRRRPARGAAPARGGSPPSRVRRSVSIKGRPGDEAVLCTGDQTYALRLAEATNTLVRPPRLPRTAISRRRP